MIPSPPDIAQLEPAAISCKHGTAGCRSRGPLAKPQLPESSLFQRAGEATMTAKKKSAALKDVERLIATPNENPIDLAKALVALELEAPGSVGGLSHSKKTSRRKLYYHLAIGQALGHLDLPSKELAAIGWTKLAIIVQHFKDIQEGDEHDALVMQALAHASKCTAKELPSILKGEPLPKAKPHSIHLRLKPGQYKIFESALLKHGAKKAEKGKGLINKEAALTRALAGHQ